MKSGLIKREDASEMVLTITIFAIFSMLATRLYLKLMNYPIVGAGRWHFAHVLDGGLLMVAGMLILVVFGGEKTRKWGAVIFGLGMGRFVDEMGKFISRDNNYFFQPAVMLIYIFFVVLFLIYRYLEKVSFKDPKTVLYHVINELEDVAEGDFEEREKIRMLQNLDLVAKKSREPNKTFALELRKLIVTTPVIKNKSENLSKLFWHKVKSFSYNKIFRKKFVLIVLLILSTAYIVSSISDTVYLLVRIRRVDLNLWYFFDFPNYASRTDQNLFTLKSIFDIATAMMFAVGIYWVVRKKRKRGINFFQYGLLIFILLTSIIRFYFEQFSAIQGLVATTVIYMGLERFKKELKT